MGLCPSRNSAKQSKFAEGKTYQPAQPAAAPAFQSTLRPDAAAFVPKKKEAAPKEPWELFLEQKSLEKKPFARRQDGTYTAEYRKLLEASKASPRKPGPGRAPPGLEKPATGAISEEVVRSWQEVLQQRRTKGPERSAKKMKELPHDPLRAALQRAKAQPSKEEVLAELANQPKPQPVDDLVAAQPCQRGVPFGLADRHYFSGEEDSSKAQVHRSRKATPCRPYVPGTVEPELEECLTEVLYKLRLLRNSEEPITGAQSRRYCVGLREVMRASKEPGVLKAVVVAPDLEEGRVDEKLQALLRVCEGRTPVVFGLSRRRLGQAIKKSVTISVLGILDTRGVQEPFQRLLKLS